MSDYNSPSERAHIFRGHLSKFYKLHDLAMAIAGRYGEAFEAVTALPKAEQKPHLPALVDLMFRRLKAQAKAGQSLNELIRAVEQAPDYAVQGIDLNMLKTTQSNIVENSKALLPQIERLGAAYINL